MELETTQDRLWAEVQALKEAFQQEREKNQEQDRQLQALCSEGWPRAVNVEEIINVGGDQSQVLHSAPFRIPSGVSVNTPYQGQLASAVGEY